MSVATYREYGPAVKEAKRLYFSEQADHKRANRWIMVGFAVAFLWMAIVYRDNEPAQGLAVVMWIAAALWVSNERTKRLEHHKEHARARIHEAAEDEARVVAKSIDKKKAAGVTLMRRKRLSRETQGLLSRLKRC